MQLPSELLKGVKRWLVLRFSFPKEFSNQFLSNNSQYFHFLGGFSYTQEETLSN